MTTETFNRTKPHVNVGTIGHLHHGKTTLTVAISAVLAKTFGGVAVGSSRLDNTPEEKNLGATVDTAHVEYVTGNRHYAHIDCPGHVDYVKNMIVGASQMDAAILVCSAVDGPGAQTREHVVLARQAGVSYILVYLNKADLVAGAEDLERVKKAVRDLLSEYDFPGDTTPIVVGSARLAAEGDSSEYGEPSILRLMEALDSYVPAPERQIDLPFLMPIEDVTTVSGVGVVVTGRIESGTVRAGDELEIVGLKDTFKTTCTGVRMFRMALDPGQAGDSAGVLLRGTKAEDVKRGQVLSKPATLVPHIKFGASIYILGKDEGGRHTPFHANYRPQFYFRTADVSGQITLGEGIEMVMPGDNVEVTVTLSAPVVIDRGLRFSVREGDRTVGVGVIVEVFN